VSTDRKVASIFDVVAAIPRGRVATYGQIAEAAGYPRHARLVGRVLGDLPDGDALPWHRVVGHTGRISSRGDGRAEREQRRRLQAEGVVFIGNRVDMKRHRWDEE
jgi:methylated-DNA-protein-cysteine methyltransferase-like protein